MTENDHMREKNRKRRGTAFYMEALALVAVFTVVILVLTRAFAQSRQMSEKARILTCAVHLAENAAEAVSASDSPETLCGLLDEGGNAEIFQENALKDFYFQSFDDSFQTEDYSRVCAWYDGEMNPSPEGDFWVEVVWLPEEADGTRIDDDRGLVRSIVTVHWDGEPIYTLETAVYGRRKP